MTIVLVLFATVAATSFDIIVARTLAVLIALESLGTALVAIAWLAAVHRESILIGGTFIAMDAGDTGLAVTLTRKSIAGSVETSNRITITTFATVSGHNVIETILTLVTIASDYVRFAATIA